MNIKVTATAVLEFDTADGLVENEEEARAEMLDALVRGVLTADAFDVESEVVA